jgi:hypothetical protein
MSETSIVWYKIINKQIEWFANLDALSKDCGQMDIFDIFAVSFLVLYSTVHLVFVLVTLNTRRLFVSVTVTKQHMMENVKVHMT